VIVLAVHVYTANAVLQTARHHCWCDVAADAVTVLLGWKK